MKRQFINEAKPFWETGNPLKAGEILYEHLRNEHRPIWAADILSHCQPLFRSFPGVSAVLEITENPKRWPEAYEAFQAIRE
ncbi:MAG TPA: hypothetical protein VN625_03250, partial [Desulfuromonadaceae bacterium]|nr:hypothetical protein [Desulfuromonadaceae bacterium]